MKPRFWTSLLIFISGYSPLALIAVCKDFNFETHALAHKLTCVIMAAVALISVIILALVMRALPGQHPVKVQSVKGRAGDLINYSIPYLVAFVTVDKFFDLSNFTAFGLFMALMFILTWKTQSLFINPILAVFGYGLYDVEFGEEPSKRDGIFLIKGDLSQGAEVRIIRLSQFLYLATRETTKRTKNEKL